MIDLVDDTLFNEHYLQLLFDMLIRLCYDSFELNGIIKKAYNNDGDEYMKKYDRKYSAWISDNKFNNNGYMRTYNKDEEESIKYNIVGKFDTNIKCYEYEDGEIAKKIHTYLLKEFDNYFNKKTNNNTLKSICTSFIINNNINYENITVSDLIDYIDNNKQKTIKDLKLNFHSIYLINTSGVNNDERGNNTFKTQLDFHDTYILRNSISLLDFIDALYRIKSHKNDYCYELYCGVTVKIYQNILLLTCKFAHGS